MAVIRIHKNKNYTTMANYHLKDKELSLKAKGLLSMMLSLPDDWKYSVRGLTAVCKESKNTVNNVLKELEHSGYLKRELIFADGKISGCNYDVYEKKLCPKNEDIENEDIENRDIYKELNKLNTKVINNTCNSQNYEQVNYSEFRELFLNTCTNLPSIRELTDARKRKVKIFLKEFSTDEAKEIFEKANASDFLCGKNSSFKATFDWLINTSNAIKVIEGNYDNNSKKKQNSFCDHMTRNNDMTDLERSLLG